MSGKFKILACIFSVFFLLAGDEPKHFSGMNGIYLPDYQIKDHGYNPFSITLYLVLADGIFSEYEFFADGPGCGAQTKRVVHNIVIRQLKSNLWIAYVSETKTKKIKYIKVIDRYTLIFANTELKKGKNIADNSILWKRLPDNKKEEFKKYLELN
jgi:hypothetical protein